MSSWLIFWLVCMCERKKEKRERERVVTTIPPRPIWNSVRDSLGKEKTTATLHINVAKDAVRSHSSACTRHRENMGANPISMAWRTPSLGSWRILTRFSLDHPFKAPFAVVDVAALLNSCNEEIVSWIVHWIRLLKAASLNSFSLCWKGWNWIRSK